MIKVSYDDTDLNYNKEDHSVSNMEDSLISGMPLFRFEYRGNKVINVPIYEEHISLNNWKIMGVRTREDFMYKISMEADFYPDIEIACNSHEEFLEFMEQYINYHK